MNTTAQPLPKAWLVIAADSFEALFLQRARAEQYAVNCSGTVWPLGLYPIKETE